MKARPNDESPELGGGGGFGQTSVSLDYDGTRFAKQAPLVGGRCAHPKEVLLRMDCGAGGTQYRQYCLTCWRAGPALPHGSIQRPDDVPPADPELIERARDAFYRGARHV